MELKGTELMKEANITLLKNAVTAEIKNTKVEIKIWENREVLAKVDGDERYAEYCRGNVNAHSKIINSLRLMNTINNLI